MAKIIEMPKLSDTMTSGTLAKWLKKEGDKVSSGDILAEVETDKATMELECFDSGILLKQFVKAGAEVAVGAPICAVGAQGEKVEVPASSGAPAKSAQAEEKKAESKPVEQPKQPEVSTPKQEPAKQEVVAVSAPASTGERIKSSPLARRIAAEKGISLAGLAGSGPGGRIVKADVLTAASAPAKTSAGNQAPQILSSFPNNAIANDEDIPVTKIRSVIAQRLLESKTQIPHFYLEVEVDAAPLLALRAQVNDTLATRPASQGGGAKFSVNDFILKACTDALRIVPAVNTSWQGDSIRQYGQVHLSFAVAIDDGLVTPVIRDCHLKSLREISADAKSLAKRARDRKLTPNEMTGGTFCISNMGMLGIDRFCAIINPPNTAILAVGSTVKKPVVVGDQIVIGQRMSLTLSADHRVVDGSVAAAFLTALKNILENPAGMLI